MSRWRPVLVAAGLAGLVALLGGAMTDTGPWYRGLEKSPLTPPDAVFPVAWTAIYALAVLSAVAGWRATRHFRERAWLISLFFVNAVLNVLWSAVFFTLQRPDWALAEVVTLWASVAALVAFLAPRAPRAAALLLPYLVWVSFAAYLNLEVVRRNAPFA